MGFIIDVIPNANFLAANGVFGIQFSFTVCHITKKETLMGLNRLEYLLTLIL
jgi:hypothetical protein